MDFINNESIEDLLQQEDDFTIKPEKGDLYIKQASGGMIVYHGDIPLSTVEDDADALRFIELWSEKNKINRRAWKVLKNDNIILFKDI